MKKLKTLLWGDSPEKKPERKTAALTGITVNSFTISNPFLSEGDMATATRVAASLPNEIVPDFTTLMQQHSDVLRSGVKRDRAHNESRDFSEEKHKKEVTTIQAQHAQELKMQREEAARKEVEAAKKIEAVQQELTILKGELEQANTKAKQQAKTNEQQAKTIENQAKTIEQYKAKIREYDKKFDDLGQEAISLQATQDQRTQKLLADIKKARDESRTILEEKLILEVKAQALEEEIKTLKDENAELLARPGDVAKAKFKPALGMYDENEGESLVNETALPDSPPRPEGVAKTGQSSDSDDEGKRNKEALTANQQKEQERQRQEAIERQRRDAARARSLPGLMLSNAGQNANGSRVINQPPARPSRDFPAKFTQDGSPSKKQKQHHKGSGANL